MKLFIAADHAGFELKEELKKYLTDLGYEVEDKGPFAFDPQDDYTDFVFPAAKAVAEKPEERRGIIVGGSGQGEVIAANKVCGIRAVLVYNEEIARLSRDHNDANIICLGARFLDKESAKRLVTVWLETPFSEEERHKRRLKKISDFEKRRL